MQDVGLEETTDITKKLRIANPEERGYKKVNPSNTPQLVTSWQSHPKGRHIAIPASYNLLYKKLPLLSY
jgi:hypothetical protein